MRKTEMRGNGENHHEKLGLQRILCTSQLTITNTAGTSPNLACSNTYTGSSQPNRATYTPAFSYPLVSSTPFSSSSPISLFLVLNSTIIAENKVKASLSISQCHDYELTLSTAYTRYSLHRVQHIPSAAYPKYSILPQLRTRSASLSLLDHSLQVYLQIRSITTIECISKLAQLESPSISLCSLDYSVQVYLQLHSITTPKQISKLSRSQPLSISLSLLDHLFRVHLELLSCTACSQSRHTVCRWVAIEIHR